MQLFIDLDGVLADFDAGYRRQINAAYRGRDFNIMDWKAVRNTQDFYLNLPPVAGYMWFWDQVKYLNPVILTGVPDNIPEAVSNKEKWIRRHLGNVPMIGCKSKEKCLHGTRGDILIDDWEKHKHRWIDIGGHWITFKSAAQAVNELRDHLTKKQMAI